MFGITGSGGTGTVARLQAPPVDSRPHGELATATFSLG